MFSTWTLLGYQIPVSQSFYFFSRLRREPVARQSTCWRLSDGVLLWWPEMLQPPFGISIPDAGCVCLVLGLDRCQMSSSGSILSCDMD